MTEARAKLPKDVEDHVVEVSLKHVLLAFGGLAASVLAVGCGIIFIRDFAKYKRQKAVIEAAKELLLTLKEGDKLWKDKKKVTS